MQDTFTCIKKISKKKKKKKNVTEKNEKKKKFGQKKIWVKKKFGLKKISVKKIYVKKQFGKKKLTQKGSIPPKGSQIGPKLVFPVCQVEIPRSHVYSPNLKRNGWKLLHLSLTAHSGTQNVPIPIGPLKGKIRNLGPYHRLDIITKEKPAKSQIKWTTASKVMIPRTFGAPKKGKYPKVAQICPKWNFLIFQVEIPINNEYRPNLKPNGWKLLHLWPTALSGTQNCPIPKSPFRGKFGYFGPYHLVDIITKEKPAKFQTKWTLASKVMRPRNFWVSKRVSTKKGPKLGP